jgi:mRNA interferase RelE/StbE
MSFETSNPSRFKVVLQKAAQEDFERLDNSVQREVAAQLLKLQSNPLAGEALGNRMGYDLRGLRKLYVCRRTIRIVWKVVADQLIVMVIGIGRRDKGEIYRLVSERWNPSE